MIATFQFVHRLWIDIMIAIQAVDWLATVVHVTQGDVTMRQVSSAAFLPVLLVVALVVLRSRLVDVSRP